MHAPVVPELHQPSSAPAHRYSARQPCLTGARGGNIWSTSPTATSLAWNWWFSMPMRLPVQEKYQGRLFARYVAWDAKRVREAPDPLAEVNCSCYFTDVESLAVTPITDLDWQRFPDNAIAHIREKNLDVLVKFGFCDLRGGILHAARYGVWAYHHGAPDRIAAGLRISGRSTTTIF